MIFFLFLRVFLSNLILFLMKITSLFSNLLNIFFKYIIYGPLQNFYNKLQFLSKNISFQSAVQDHKIFKITHYQSTKPTHFGHYINDNITKFLWRDCTLSITDKLFSWSQLVLNRMNSIGHSQQVFHIFITSDSSRLHTGTLHLFKEL